MTRIGLLTLVSTLLVLVLPAQTASAQGTPSPESSRQLEDVASLPVTGLVIYSNGVGYFEHAGTVQGDQSLQLSVPTSDMDDLLQSLVLQDFDGGSVQAVRYPSQDPLPRLLGSYSLDLSGDPTLAQLLSQARGETVVVSAGEDVEGVIVNIERQQHPEEGTEVFLTLSTETGLIRVLLSEVRELQFERPEIQAELAAALEAIAVHRDSDDKQVTLRFTGEGERRVSIGYVREMPVWKSSYRLVVGEDETGQLQGWAIVDNPTDLDMEDISLTFVAGQPISFITELYAPLYVDRPRVALETGPAIVSPEYDQEAPALSRMMEQEAADDFAGFAAAPAPMEESAPRLADGGVRPQAEGAQRGSSYAYTVSEPVTVSRHQSALVPIVQQELEVEPLSVYNRSVLDVNPLRGVRLTNDSTAHLSAGPISVFDDGGFAGNARMGEIAPGESRILTYAVDSQTEVWPTSSTDPQQVTAVSLRRGTLETELRERVRTEYRIVASGGDERFVVIEHPKRNGFEVVAPEEAPAETAELYRFGIEVSTSGGEASGDDEAVPTHLACDASAECTLEVVLERVVSRTLALSNVSNEQIAYYLENVELSAEDRETLSRIRAFQDQIALREREIDDRQARIEEIHRDQSRIRQNMQALDRNSSLYRRYLSDLEEQEDRIDGLMVEIEEQRDVLESARSQLDALLDSLGEE